MKIAQLAISCAVLFGCSAVSSIAAAQDNRSAVIELARACDAGSMVACASLGEMYAHSQGVPFNGALAARLLAKACDGRVAAACNTLSLIYSNGSGVERNVTLAGLLKKKAVSLDPALASENVLPYPRSPLRPYERGIAPATARDRDLLERALLQDSGSWRDNFDKGSVHNVMIVHVDGPRRDIRGDFTVDGQYNRWATITVNGSTIECIAYYQMTALNCLPLRTEKKYNDAMPASKSQVALVEAAMRMDSQSWLSSEYALNSLTDVRVADNQGNIAKLVGEFSYAPGGTNAFVAQLQNGKVICIGTGYGSQCDPVRTQTRGQALAAWQQENRAEAARAREECLRNRTKTYVLDDQCG